VLAEKRLELTWSEFSLEETAMAQSITIQLDLPGDLARFKLPPAVDARLKELLDRQDGGAPLNERERLEAEGLVDLAELLTLLRLRAEDVASKGAKPKRT
jgi:hypothetical protein